MSSDRFTFRLERLLSLRQKAEEVAAIALAEARNAETAAHEAKAALDFKSLQFNFMVNSNQLITGVSTNIRKTGTTTVLQVVNEFSSKSLNPSVLNAFKTGTGTFGISGSTTLQLPATVIAHPIQLDFKEEGGFKLR